MDSDVDLVRSLCRHGRETEWVEFKCGNKDPKAMARNFSALANSAALNGKPHGYLLWGVEDGTGKLVGTTFDPERSKGEGSQPLESWLLQQLHPKIDFQFRSAMVEGKRIVIAEIPCASGEPVRAGSEKYVRVGATTRSLHDYPERERKLWLSFDRTQFEKRMALEGLNSEEVLDLLDYNAYFDLLKRPVLPDRNQIVRILSSEGLICLNDSGRWDIPNLGAVLLARKLRDFPDIDLKAVRVIRYPGKDRLETTREQVGTRGYASGFEDLIGFIVAALPGSREVIEGGLRRDVRMLPEVAIRELVANMLVHQDFAIRGAGPMVEIFADRVEFTNPGQPLIDVDRFLDDPPSSRNERMSSLMHRFGICERRGSGIDKAVAAIEREALPAPLFESPSRSTRTTLYGRKSLKDMSRSETSRAIYLHACLQHQTGKRTTNASIRERFGIARNNAAQVSRMIRKAIDEGRIANANAGSGSRNRCYVPYWADRADKPERPPPG